MKPWQIGLVIGSTCCFAMGLVIGQGVEGLLWIVLGWILRIEYLIKYND